MNLSWVVTLVKNLDYKMHFKLYEEFLNESYKIENFNVDNFYVILKEYVLSEEQEYKESNYAKDIINFYWKYSTIIKICILIRIKRRTKCICT
jgi:hypothetical protein